jgi:hypothetical protein
VLVEKPPTPTPPIWDSPFTPYPSAELEVP